MSRLYHSPNKLILPAALALAALTTPQVGAVPAYRGLLRAVQPDGTVMEYRKIGDERNHILVSTDGCLLSWNGLRLEYAACDARGKVTPTGILAHESRLRTASEREWALTISDEGQAIFERRVGVDASAAAPRRNVPGRFTSSFPPTGDVNVLVVLVEYQDEKFRLDNPYEYFNGMLNEEGFSEWGGTGCAKEYFKENSRDQFRPHFDVFGPVTLPEEMVYYGGNDSWGSDRNASKMVVHAAELLDDKIDFSRYDMDDDGFVDNIFIIYAGQGEATFGGPDTVWPHSYDLIKDMEFDTRDGKILNHYACCNEWLNDRPDGVGTFIHEFSHVIGLPDLYSTQGRINATPSSWSVLDYGPYNNGGCTPPNYSAYERAAMGWLDPREVEGTMNLRLEEIGASNDAGIIKLPGNENEYFLFENRQQRGWDTYLPGHGMLVWHVDYQRGAWEGNDVNNDAAHQRVDIIEAGGKTDMNNRDILAQYPWPGTLCKTELGFNTTPKLSTWAGANTGVELTDIEESADGVIMARINGGIYTLDTPVFSTLEGKDNSFRASWGNVEGATAYELEVTAIYDGEAGTDLNNMGNGSKLALPEGWTSGATKVYTTSGNYGKAAPSYKMETDGDWMLSPEYPSDVTSLSFWMKGTQTIDSTVEVLGLIAGEWQSIETFIPQNNKAQTCEVELPAGVRRVKLQYNMVKGRVALDDIEIVYGRLSHPLEGYYPLTVAVGSEAVVDCSATDARSFLCRVRALSNDDKSRWSEPARVEVSGSGVSVVPAITALRVQGHEITAAGDAVIRVYDLAGREVASGRGSLVVPAAGFYIVSCGEEVMKVSIR